MRQNAQKSLYNFLVDLSRVPFHMAYFFESLDDQTDAFNCLFLEVLDVYAPFKREKIKSRHNPFITKEIKQLMKTRDLWVGTWCIFLYCLFFFKKTIENHYMTKTNNR